MALAAAALALGLASCGGMRSPTATVSDAISLLAGGAEPAPPPKITAPKPSRLHMLAANENAFGAVLALADSATRTLDAQYYIFQKDTTGLILVDRLIRAADRGVKVRLLVDDLGLVGVSPQLRMMNAHPNIEVRLFNPLGGRQKGLGRVVDFCMDPRRLNRRMHNKLFAADGRWLVTGGRNVGDQYFTTQHSTYFKDLDLLATGPLAQEAEKMFQAYWACEWAAPLGIFFTGRERKGDLAALRRWQHAVAGKAETRAALAAYETSGWRTRLQRGQIEWIQSPARLVFDQPDKIEYHVFDEGSLLLGAHLTKRASSCRHDLIIASPYFVPGPKGVEFLSKLRASGTRVRVLTNSLAATDVAVVHGGYARYREALLRAGVEIYELKPDAKIKRRWKPGRGGSRSCLHAKTFVFDGREVFVGSFNIDPRSARLNTEMGLLADSPRLAEQVTALLHEATQPAASYRLALGAHGRLEWHGEDLGKKVVYHADPKAGHWRHFMAFWAAVLPIEDQL